jgi:hypothetical protein
MRRSGTPWWTCRVRSSATARSCGKTSLPGAAGNRHQRLPPARGPSIRMDEARLVVPQGAGFRTVAVTRFPFRLGRHHENDLVLEEGDVSRHHAEIVKEGDRPCSPTRTRASGRS